MISIETLKGTIVTEKSTHSGIYAIINLQNNKFYIGRSMNLYARKKGHFNKLKSKKHKNSHLQNAFNKYSNYFIMVEIEKVEDINLLPEREQYWLDELKPYDRTIGYNICTTADGIRNYRHTEATRQKLREINIGKKLSRETVAIIVKNLTGRPVSEETKRKISESNKRTKLSKHYQENHNKKATKVIQKSLDGTPIKIWDRIKQAATTLNLASSNIVHVCKNNRKSTGGFKWEYYK